MTTLLLRKTPAGALEPVDELGRNILGKVSAGAVLRADVRRPRNIGHHRKFWALISLIYENQTRYKSPEDLVDAIKVYVGHSKVLRMTDGREVHTPLSIAFSNMDQTEFERFYDKVVTVICEQIIPGMDREDLEREILELVA